METQEVWSRHQAELAEPQQSRRPVGESSEDPPTIGETKLKGRIDFVVTYGWRWTELRGIACLFTPPLLLRRILFLFVFLFVFGHFCFSQQRSSAECCVGREFQDHCFWYPTSYLANCQFYGECYPWRIGQLIYSLLLSMGPQVLFSRLGKLG